MPPSCILVLLENLLETCECSLLKRKKSMYIPSDTLTWPAGCFASQLQSHPLPVNLAYQDYKMQRPASCVACQESSHCSL